MTGINPQTGQPQAVRLDPDGNLPVAGGDSDLASLMRELILELRLLRLGMCAANDAVCVDLDGDLTPVTTSEE